MSKNLIEQLTALNAISGREKNVSNFLKNHFSNFDCKIYGDKLGSFVAEFDSNVKGPNICIVAHMDEVGFMVKQITDDGFIKVANTGGIMPNTVTSNVVVLTNRDNIEFKGTILVKSPHQDDKSELTIDTLVFDFGFSSKEEVLNSKINIGDMITYEQNFNIINSNKIISKALDNRLGCAVICELAEKFNSIKAGKVFLCASVQEEVGLRGAKTILNCIDSEIDYIMVVDVSPVEDAFSSSDGVKLGLGCLLRVKDPRTILDYEQFDVIRNLASKNNIKLQNYFSKGGTDATELQVTNSGYVTSAICIGGRNLHSQSSVVDYNDYCAARDLIYEFTIDKLRG